MGFTPLLNLFLKSEVINLNNVCWGSLGVMTVELVLMGSFLVEKFLVLGAGKAYDNDYYFTPLPDTGRYLTDVSLMWLS